MRLKEAMQKLYVIVRQDLKPGAQVAQSGHAIAAFARAHRETFEAWTDGPNNLVVIAIAGELELDALRQRLGGARLAAVHEPDLGDQLTAIAVEATDATARLVSTLPLALRDHGRAAA
jgi:hypothetical protein